MENSVIGIQTAEKKSYMLPISPKVTVRQLTINQYTKELYFTKEIALFCQVAMYTRVYTLELRKKSKRAKLKYIWAQT